MRYRKVDTRVWNDAKFRALADDDKLVFLLLLTHPGMTALGALPSHANGLAHMLKWSPKRFGEALGGVLENGLAEYDEDEGLICLPNFLKYNPPENPNVVKAWVSCADMLPECDLKSRTLSRAYKSLLSRPKSFAEAFVQQFGKPLPQMLPNRMPNQEQEPEPEQEQEPEPKDSAPERKNLAHTREREQPNVMLMSMAEVKEHLQETGALADDEFGGL
ncbi:hypothetical protein [Mesorhizobium sp. WSM4313]|uniref:hypothetical protein n=1 Tax=Mesorhizobium sp. WSM4313 TaxID=2029412 RepID=UPI000BAFEC8F|nr:hypothetical protein [Mesorhizobium sp. WSM4313]PBB21143.1 hypothetical protein CK219_00445 [Mesorhizobium sp. WSM4313]